MATGNVDVANSKRPRSSPGGSDHESGKDILSALAEVKASLLSKMDDLILSVRTDFNSKIAALSAMIDVKLAESADKNIALINEEVKKLSDASVNVGNSANLSGIEKRIDKLEREENMNSLILSGIPLVEGENLEIIISSVCSAIKYNCDPIASIVHVHRLSSRKIAPSSSSSANLQHSRRVIPPIFIKFSTFENKMLFFSCYLKSRLNISQIGFMSSARVFINEKLSKKNYEIFKKAKDLKKSGNLFNYHSFRGLVFVRRFELSNTVCVCSLDELSLIIM